MVPILREGRATNIHVNPQLNPGYVPPSQEILNLLVPSHS